jgi:protein-tyrosine phosphatase
VTRILFVCMGNICRSPTAEGVMRAMVERAGLGERVRLDSAGTGPWHVGSPPDARARATARARGYTLDGSARLLSSEDFVDFDLLLAMDRENLNELLRLAADEEGRAKVRLLREFDPASAVPAAGAVSGAGAASLDVPDPYYGATGGFEEVLDMVEAACAGLLEQIRSREPA